jgi:hypothetical protein
MNNIGQKIKSPAIALLIAGILNGLISFLTLLGGLFRLALGVEKMPVAEAERMGYLAGTLFGYGVALLSLIATPIIIYGAIQMMKGKKYGLAKTASVLAIIPLTSCCFLVGTPLGIWAFVTLINPEVKAYFFGEGSRIGFSPPSPPNFN